MLLEGGLNPPRHHMGHRRPDTSTKRPVCIRFEKNAHRRAHESAPTRAPARKTPRDVLLYLRCVNGLRQDDSARVAVRGEPQPLPQMLCHDLPQVLAAAQPWAT